MEQSRNRTRSISLKKDTSRTELLPADSGLCSPSLKNEKDSPETQLHSTTLVVDGWPQSFKTLRRAGWKKAASLAIDTFIALIPLVFVGKFQIAHTSVQAWPVVLLTETVLSIVAIRLSGTPIPTSGDRVKAATTLVF